MGFCSLILLSQEEMGRSESEAEMSRRKGIKKAMVSTVNGTHPIWGSRCCDSLRFMLNNPSPFCEVRADASRQIAKLIYLCDIISGYPTLSKSDSIGSSQQQILTQWTPGRQTLKAAPPTTTLSLRCQCRNRCYSESSAAPRPLPSEQKRLNINNNTL